MIIDSRSKEHCPNCGLVRVVQDGKPFHENVRIDAVTGESFVPVNRVITMESSKELEVQYLPNVNEVVFLTDLWPEDYICGIAQ